MSLSAGPLMESVGEGAVASERLCMSEAEDFGHDAEGREKERRRERRSVEAGTGETMGSPWLRRQERGAGGAGGKKARAVGRASGGLQSVCCAVREVTLCPGSGGIFVETGENRFCVWIRAGQS